MIEGYKFPPEKNTVPPKEPIFTSNDISYVPPKLSVPPKIKFSVHSYLKYMPQKVFKVSQVSCLYCSFNFFYLYRPLQILLACFRWLKVILDCFRSFQVGLVYFTSFITLVSTLILCCNRFINILKMFLKTLLIIFFLWFFHFKYN